MKGGRAPPFGFDMSFSAGLLAYTRLGGNASKAFKHIAHFFHGIP